MAGTCSLACCQCVSVLQKTHHIVEGQETASDAREEGPEGNRETGYMGRYVYAFFTARRTLVQSAVLRSHVVCLSVCNVDGL